MKKQMPLPSLTEKEKGILEYIEISILENGISPSFQEIKDHFGFASFNSVQNYLKQLTTKGYIHIPVNQKRAIQIIHSSDSFRDDLVNKKVQIKSKSHKKTQELESSGSSYPIPLMGKVAAGRPLEALAHDEYVDVPLSLMRNQNKTFALKVSGDSMIEDGIHDGDIILVQDQANASNGEIVVASVENESTVKRFFLRPHPQNKNKMIELRPANSTMSSMWYDPEQVQIKGILVGLIRKF